MSNASQDRRLLGHRTAHQWPDLVRPGDIIMVAYSLMLLYFASLLQRHAVSRLILPLLGTALPLLAGALSKALRRRHLSNLGAWLLLGSLLMVAPLTTTAVTGVGLILAAAGVVAALQTASQALPRSQLSWAIGASLASSMATLLVDRFWSGQRVALLEAGAVLSIIVATLILVVGFNFARQYRDLTIRTKLISVAFLSTAVALAVLTAFSNHATRRLLVDGAGIELDRLASAQAVAIGDLLGRQTALLELLGQSPALQSRLRLANAAYPEDAPDLRQRIEASTSAWTTAEPAAALVQDVMEGAAALELNVFRRANPSHFELLLTDRHGALVASTDRTRAYYHADAGWWQAAYDGGQGERAFGQLESRPGTDALALSLAIPIRDTSSGDVLGILQALYSMDAFDQLLAPLGLADTTSAMIVLPDGAIYSPFDRIPEEIDPQTVARLRAAGEGDLAEVDLDGNASLVGEAPVKFFAGSPAIDGPDWTLIVVRPEAEVLAPMGQRRGDLALVGLLLLAGSVAIVAIMAGNVTGSLSRLTETALRLEAGDLSAQAPVESRDELGKLALVFNNITRQLRQTVAKLERQVSHRTHALEASVQVSRTLSSILDQEQLVSEVVEQVRSAFGYYHAHIYLIDEANGDLIMAGGTGLAGKTMLDAGHRIKKGRGLVGRAAATKEGVLAPDVKRERNWLSNPLLPDTESEIAVPIAIRGQVLGVLDIQHDVVGGLTEEDARLLQSVANQVAIALRNARLYQQAQQQAERQKLINAINQKIHGATTIDEVLQVTVSELGRALDTERASVQLGFSKAPSNGRD